MRISQTIYLFARGSADIHTSEGVVCVHNGGTTIRLVCDTPASAERLARAVTEAARQLRARHHH